MNKYGLEQEYQQISQGGPWIMNSTVDEKQKVIPTEMIAAISGFQSVEPGIYWASILVNLHIE